MKFIRKIIRMVKRMLGMKVADKPVAPVDSAKV